MVDSACRIPTDAEDDWMIAVTPAPTSTPSTGLEIAANRSANCGRSASGATAPSMTDMPMNRIPKPVKISAISRVRRFFAIIIMITPTSTMIYARFFGLSRSMNRLPLPSPPDRRRICAVIVVPILAPRITPTDCLSVMIPAFTKPTTITVVADED